MTNGGSNNIFLTTENLAFSFPLIFVCASYAYFKYVPLPIALSILVAVLIIYQIRAYVQAHKAKKLTVLDDSMVRELAGEEDIATEAEKKKAQDAAKKQRKQKVGLEMRLAAEKKAQRKASQNNKGSAAAAAAAEEEGLDDDDDALLMFAKGSREKKKK